MKKLFAQSVILAAFFAACFANIALASDGGSLIIENKSSGRSYNIEVKSDGSFDSPALPPGEYSFRFKVGSTVPHQVKLNYEVVAPRDHASGQASGKRAKTTEAKVVLGGIKTGEESWRGGSIAID